MYLVTWRKNGSIYDEYFPTLASAERFAVSVKGSVRAC
jgi:hypothetical protein